MSFILNILKGLPSILLKYWKQIGVIILVLASCIGISTAIKEHKARVEAENSLKYYNRIEHTAATIISRSIDDSGRVHVQINAAEHQIKENEIKRDGKPSIVDTTASALKIAKDQIRELTRVNATLLIAAKANSNITTTKADGTNTITLYRYQDKYASMTFNPIDTTFGLKYDLNLNTTQYTKKTGFLGTSRSNIIDLYSDDKRVTINGVDRYSVATKDPNFGFKLQLKAQTNLQNGGFAPALTGELNYKRASLEGNYFYNFKTKTRTPSVSIKYDILKF